MPTKADTEIVWSREYPSLAYGTWFWLRHAPDAKPELHQLTGGRTWMESFGIVRDTTEFLGPALAADFEQLIQLRKAGRDAVATIQKLVNVLDLQQTQRGMAIDADRIASALSEALAPTEEKS